MLQALIDAKVDNVAFGTIFDPGTVQQAIAAGVGAEIDVVLGGHTDPSMGAPVKARALVKMLSDGSFKNDGPMMNAGVGDVDGADRGTAHRRHRRRHHLQPHPDDRPAGLSQPGNRPTDEERGGGEERAALPAAYAPIAREIVLVDSGGICSPDLTRLKFTKLRRPIWPLDGVNDPYAGSAPERWHDTGMRVGMNITREAPFPGASFGATVRLAGDAAEIVAAAERDPGRLPAELAAARGLLLIQGMNGISNDPDLLIRLSRVFGPEVEDYRIR